MECEVTLCRHMECEVTLCLATIELGAVWPHRRVRTLCSSGWLTNQLTGDSTVDTGGEGPVRAATPPPHSGPRSASGAMQKPSGHIRLTLKLCPSATAANGEVLRWHSGVKGLQERSYEACTTQTDYKQSALTLKEVGGAPLSELLGSPLGKLNEGVLIREAQRRVGSGSLPFKIGQHPEAQSTNAKSSLARLADDYSTFFNRTLQKVSLAGLPLGGSPSVDQLDAAEEALRRLQQRLQACGAEERAFVALASAELMDAANELGLAGSRTAETSVLKPAASVPGAADARYRFALLRHSGHESPIWFEYVVGCLLSSRAHADLHKLNPFISDERCKEMLCGRTTIRHVLPPA